MPMWLFLVDVRHASIAPRNADPFQFRMSDRQKHHARTARGYADRNVIVGDW
jgi:hypothetical protein